MNLSYSATDWIFIIGGVLAVHVLFVIGSHAGLWGTDPHGHIHLG